MCIPSQVHHMKESEVLKQTIDHQFIQEILKKESFFIYRFNNGDILYIEELKSSYPGVIVYYGEKNGNGKDCNYIPIGMQSFPSHWSHIGIKAFLARLKSIDPKVPPYTFD